MREFQKIQEPGFIYRFLSAPWIWAIAATWGFYQQIPKLPVGKELALRYFCGHPLERVLAALFFVGLSIIGIKAILLIFERRAFRAVPDFGISDVSENTEQNITRLQSRLTSASGDLVNTQWGRRLEHLLAFFKGQKSGKGVGEHLTYLSEADNDRLHASHALLQTVIWSIPILGFLGTVMGITLAIANVTPDQLDTSLDEVTSGLAVAFDTTALALSMSLVLGFTSLFVKRAEEALLSEIDERCRLEVNRCFPIGPGTNNHPLLDAETKASQVLLEQTAAMIARQTAAWSSSLEELRQQWATTLSDQQQRLAGTLNSGAEQTLSNHALQLNEYREQLLATQDRMASSFVQQLEQLESRRRESEKEMLQQMQTWAHEIHTNTENSAREHQDQVNRTLAAFAGRIESWQSSTESTQQNMQKLAQLLVQQSEAFMQHGQQLERIVGQEESLLRLQQQLDQNLESVRTAETFEQTLHNLTAAVNLLTSRSRNRDAA